MIHRYECPKCGWYADISDEPDMAHFSTSSCYNCGGKLEKIGPVNKI